MLEAARTGQRHASVTLPASVAVPTSQLSAFNAELHFNAAVARFSEADFESALVSLDSALALDDEFAQARGFRAATLLSLGRPQDAMADAEKAAAFDSRLTGLRAALLAHLGRKAQALIDAKEAAQRWPKDTTVLLWCATAQLYCGEFALSEATLDAILLLSPADAQAANLKSALDQVWKLGPGPGREYAEILRRLPIPISDAMVGAKLALQGQDIRGAAQGLRRALWLIRQETDPGHVQALRDFHAEERCLYFLIAAHSSVGAQESDPELRELARPEVIKGLCDELVAIRPQWASVYLVKASEGARIGVTVGEIIALLEKGAAQAGGPDPVLDEINLAIGSRRGAAFFALSLLYSGAVRNEEDGVALHELSKRLLGPGLESDLLDALMEAFKNKGKNQFVEFNRHFLALPENLKTDMVQVWVVGVFGAIAVMGPDEAGDSKAMRAAAVKYLRLTNVPGLPARFMELMGFMRLGVAAALSKVHTQALEEHAAWLTLKALAEGDGATRAEVERTLSNIRTEALDNASEDAEGSSAAFVRANIGIAFQSEVENLVSLIEQRARNDEALTAKLAPMRAALEDYRKSIATDTEADATYDLIAATTSEIDLRMWSRIHSEMERMAGSNRLPPEQAVTLAKQKAAIDAKARQLATQWEVHDWAAWESASVAVASGSDSKANGAQIALGASGHGVPLWLSYIGGGAALIVLAVWVILRMRRKAPRAP